MGKENQKEKLKNYKRQYAIDVRKVLSVTRKFFEEYNAKFGPVARNDKRLLKPHTMLVAVACVKMYSKQLADSGKHLVPAGSNESEELVNNVWLKTNNAKIGGFVKLSKRSVMDHIAKLKEAGFFSNSIWHGSANDYELQLNPKLISVVASPCAQEIKDQINEIFEKQAKELDLFPKKSSSIAKNPPLLCKSETLDNSITTDVKKVSTSDDEKISSEVEQVEAETKSGDKEMLTEAESDQGKPTPKEEFEAVENREGAGAPNEKEIIPFHWGKVAAAGTSDPSTPAVEINQSPDPEPTDQTSNPEVTAEETLPPGKDREQFTKQFPEHLTAEIGYSVDEFHREAMKLLYPDKDFNPLQHKRFKKKMVYFFSYCKSIPDVRLRLSMMLERLRLAKSYFDNHPTYNRHYPEYYFDPENKNGFTVTKAWYAKNIEKQLRIRKTRSIQEALKRLTEMPVPAIYKLCLDKLARFGDQKVIDRFNKAIADNEKIQNVELNAI